MFVELSKVSSPHHFDPFQFAHCSNCSVDDAVSLTLRYMFPSTWICAPTHFRLLIIDFSFSLFKLYKNSSLHLLILTCQFVDGIRITELRNYGIADVDDPYFSFRGKSVHKNNFPRECTSSFVYCQ